MLMSIEGTDDFRIEVHAIFRRYDANLMAWSITILFVAASSAVAALKSPVLVSRPVSAVRFVGEGRRNFLHGLCTAQVKDLTASGVLDASIVDTTGKVSDVLTVIDCENALLGITSPAGRGAALATFFDKYAFPADKVAIEDASATYGHSTWELSGEEAKALLCDVLGVDAAVLPAAGTSARVPAGDDNEPVLVLGVGSLGFDEAKVRRPLSSQPCPTQPSALSSTQARLVRR